MRIEISQEKLDDKQKYIDFLKSEKKQREMISRSRESLSSFGSQSSSIRKVQIIKCIYLTVLVGDYFTCVFTCLLVISNLIREILSDWRKWKKSKGT